VNNVLITHRVLSTRLIATLINAGIGNKFVMYAVAYAVAILHVLSFIKIGVHKLVLFIDKSILILI